ncbi:MAG: 30S ribosomal protein S15 [Alphaproteobacteria bacterium]|nr:30S ribosomal protein S15 [Alphaproteobacteria bacterium]
MSINQEVKTKLINEYQSKEGDTGSVEVQCAILTTRITNLTAHFKENHKDFTSRRGLLILVGRRRRLLAYLKSRSLTRYLNLIEKLGIRK